MQINLTYLGVTTLAKQGSRHPKRRLFARYAYKECLKSDEVLILDNAAICREECRFLGHFL